MHLTDERLFIRILSIVKIDMFFNLFFPSKYHNRPQQVLEKYFAVVSRGCKKSIIVQTHKLGW